MIIPIKEYEELVKPLLEAHRREKQRLESELEYWKLRCKWAEYQADNPEDFYEELLNESCQSKN